MSESSYKTGIADLPAELVAMVLPYAHKKHYMLSRICLTNKALAKALSMSSLWQAVDLTLSPLVTKSGTDLTTFLQLRYDQLDSGTTKLTLAVPSVSVSGPHLRSLAICNAHVVEFCTIINLCPSLENFDFSGSTSAVCDLVPRPNNLTHLRHHHNGLMAIHFRMIAPFSRKLHFLGTSPAIFADLNHIPPSVQILEISGYAYSDDDVKSLAQLPNLKGAVFSRSPGALEALAPPNVQIVPSLSYLISSLAPELNQEEWLTKLSYSVRLGASKLTPGAIHDIPAPIRLVTAKHFEFSNNIHMRALKLLISSREDGRPEWAGASILGFLSDLSETDIVGSSFQAKNFNGLKRIVSLLGTQNINPVFAIKQATNATGWEALEWLLKTFPPAVERYSLEKILTNNLYRYRPNELTRLAKITLPFINQAELIEQLVRTNYQTELVCPAFDLFAPEKMSLSNSTPASHLLCSILHLMATIGFPYPLSNVLNKLLAFETTVRNESTQTGQFSGQRYPPAIFLAAKCTNGVLPLIHKHGGDLNLVHEGKSVLEVVFEATLETQKTENLEYMLTAANDISTLQKKRVHEMALSMHTPNLSVIPLLQILYRFKYHVNLQPSTMHRNFVAIRSAADLKVCLELGFVVLESDQKALDLELVRHCILMHDIELVKMVVEAANLKTSPIDPITGDSLCHIAARISNNTEVLAWLQEKLGAEAFESALNAKKQTPFLAACEKSNVPAVRWFSAQFQKYFPPLTKPDVDASANTGLHYAVFATDPQSTPYQSSGLRSGAHPMGAVVRVLIELGHPVNIRNWSLRKPIGYTQKGTLCYSLLQAAEPASGCSQQ